MRLSTFKHLFIFLVITGFLSSCKKDSSQDSAYYLKFKIDGNWVTWTKALGELVPDLSTNQSNFALSAHDGVQSEVFNIGIQVNGNFVAGKYTPDNSFLSVAYTKKTGTADFKMYTGGGIFGGPATRYEITITSVTDKVIKGNFKGTYLENSSNNTDTVAITEGEFVVPQIR